MASAERSMSSPVVCQPETEIRIAARPAQVVPPSKHDPERRTTALRGLDEGATDVPDVRQRQVTRDPPVERWNVLVIERDTGDRAVQPPRVTAHPERVALA
jgi:hypothetical protein